MLPIEQTMAGVDAALAKLTDLYRKGDLAGYLQCFSPYARIILPSGVGIPAQGFLGGRVIAYTSDKEHKFLLLGDSAVFSHAVTVELEDTLGERTTYRLYETLVLQQVAEGRWQVVHQHLSERPTPE